MEIPYSKAVRKWLKRQPYETQQRIHRAVNRSVEEELFTWDDVPGLTPNDLMEVSR